MCKADVSFRWDRNVSRSRMFTFSVLARTGVYTAGFTHDVQTREKFGLSAGAQLCSTNRTHFCFLYRDTGQMFWSYLTTTIFSFFPHHFVTEKNKQKKSFVILPRAGGPFSLTSLSHRVFFRTRLSLSRVFLFSWEKLVSASAVHIIYYAGYI